MAEKRYHDDWAKARAREQVKSMIERNLLKFRRPSELRVLCFPGVDAQEVFEVYDSLGIPRGNITGLEREPDIAQRLREMGLGIDVQGTTLEDYISSQPSVSFDIVSLDFIGPISQKQVEAMQNMIQAQWKKHFVLHCANLLRRDHNSMALYYYGYAVHHACGVIEGVQLPTPSSYAREISQHMNSFSAKQGGDKPLKEEKTIGYSAILEGICAAATVKGLDDLLRYVISRIGCYEGGMRALDAQLGKVFRNHVKLNRESPFSTLMGTEFYPVVQNVLEDSIYQIVGHICRQQGLKDEETAFASWMMLADSVKSDRYYRAKDAFCYSYISESGAPMIGNVLFLSYPERQQSCAREFAKAVAYPFDFDMKTAHRYKAARKMIRDYFREWQEFYPESLHKQVFENLRNRVFLGNSARPLISKARAIEEFKRGSSVEDVTAKYRGCDTKPLAQWKAHVTMGTYDEPKPESGDGDITKEEALDLLSSNIPVEEIASAFPAFTVSQLRGFKAHMTMGYYSSD